MVHGRWHRYRFHSDWWLESPPAAVYAVLDAPEAYPAWWPQVREAVETSPGVGYCRFRSVLPFELRVTVRAVRRDPDAGVLHAALGGDLDGWLRWTLTLRAGGTRVSYEQDTELRRRSLRLLPGVARPVLRANHALMMRSGRRGLRAAARARHEAAAGDSSTREP